MKIAERRNIPFTNITIVVIVILLVVNSKHVLHKNKHTKKKKICLLRCDGRSKDQLLHIQIYSKHFLLTLANATINEQKKKIAMCTIMHYTCEYMRNILGRIWFYAVHTLWCWLFCLRVQIKQNNKISSRIKRRKKKQQQQQNRRKMIIILCSILSLVL